MVTGFIREKHTVKFCKWCGSHLLYDAATTYFECKDCGGYTEK